MSIRILGRTLALAATLALVLVPAAMAKSYGAKSDNAQTKGGDIVSTAKVNGSFKTLIAALEATGLDKTLKQDGPFTVFAPTDEAFAKLPAGTVEALLQDKAKLSDILLYHVVSGKVLAADVVNLTSATTVNNKTLRISTTGGVKVNDSKVLITDVLAKNGVIHVIDTVLIP
jgi:uncharacterized surface protein with fasciclin (FAS1) repeats